MKYYPVFMNIQNKNCLVVGGGRVGLRKAATLEKCRANVTLVSNIFPKNNTILKRTSIVFKDKEYEEEDVKGMFFVFAATDNSELNQEIKNDAARRDILCNIADSPGKSDFILPSIVDRGDLAIAVSTSGSSPAMAKRIREDLEQLFGFEYAHFLSLMAGIRKKLLQSEHDPEEHKRIFTTLIEKGVLDLIKKNDEKKINLILHDVLGKKYWYQDFISLKGDE